MLMRRGQYEKKDVVNALKRVSNDESYAEVARTSSVPLRTLFKKAQGQHSEIMIEGMRTHVNIGKFCTTFYHYILPQNHLHRLFFESVTFCCGHGILMISLPASAKHIFQPLDVAVHKPFFKPLSASVYSFKCIKRRTQRCPNIQSSRLRAMHTAAPSLRTPAIQLRASGVLDYTLFLLSNSSSVSVSIKLME